ncbi:family 65 glycosyl hydrolase [Modestobacter sp. I12A-02628]|uniref:Glycoside hydrolase family 65 protein n=1 Tax=Goekera deserti TaxID=2497753 RepID=A0A7K3WE00_9ACTN|nr:glycosyl hydrolase family 65 protein [Goekera deserti]MPQ99538.1 family 65 glycosyl hydrolase [Goekera deserti]NDI46450.1 family 65 glycosyl hydrolase [Goekera deserti]NEL54617.1 glycoside hydrolase family 65 protein [Goekera deserti]
MPAPSFETDPWTVREPHLELGTLGVAESVFSLSNGYLGIRGTLDELEPHVSRGTYLSGVHETHPLSYPEGGYGHPEEGEALLTVADGTPVRLLVDGVPLDVRELRFQLHERTLDLRSGTLDRRARWTTAAGTTVEMTSRRLVSLRERSIAAVRYEVRALDGPAHVVVRSELVDGEATPTGVDNDDPRVAEQLDHAFESLTHERASSGGALAARTRRSGITVAAAVGHRVQGGALSTYADVRQVVATVVASLDAGESVTVVKTVAHTWSHDADPGSLTGEAWATVDSALDLGWDGLLAGQRAVLDELWATADVEVDGDPELQQALRYGVFRLACATACISGAPVGAKGLTGIGYSGHTFWDVEGFVLPALTLLRPDAAARLLRWRAGTLDHARERARTLGVAGASFAWRTISGREVSAYWPASTAAVHVNADIARAFWLHQHVTGDDVDSLGGLEVLVETARLWACLGHEDAAGAWHLFGVTGPDEYTGVVDDNVFTNLMARRNLRWAADACRRWESRAAELGVDHAEIASWRAAADAVHVPWDEGLGVHPMNTNFTSYREWDFDESPDAPAVQEENHYATFYRRQVLKQADLVQALWWCRQDFTAEQVARDLEYYEARTVRDSSLSASIQAVVCAQAQHPDLALRYLRECALVDLRDVQGDTAKGLHMAAVAGSWLALVAGLGGLREDGEDLELAPLLPAALSRTAYHATWRGRLLRVQTTRDGTTVTLLRGEGPVPVVVDGERLTVTGDAPAHAPLRDPAPLLAEPRQPPGHEPRT